MTKERNPNLKLVHPPDPAEKGEIRRPVKKNKNKQVLAGGILAFLFLVGVWLLWINHTYSAVRLAVSYKRETSDSNRYAVFGKGIVRYSRDGVAFLDSKNEEVWIQPSQFSNPSIDVSELTFAVGDVGGNSIQVFTKEGIKGEIETTLPIEKLSVSDQGIVSAILKNEASPLIMMYDSAGNVLVENQAPSAELGYPTGLEMSPDGTILAVSYLGMAGGLLKSSVVYYNFGEPGRQSTNHQVSMDVYNDSIMPEIFFMNASTSVVVGDHSFVIYRGKEKPEKKVEVEINQEIKSTFHTKKYIGFVLLNQNKSGYEVRLYNRSGRQIVNRAFAGEYNNVLMEGNEVILYEGSRCCIITASGVVRFKGDLQVDALVVMPAGGVNKYLVMSADELRAVYLAK